MQRHKPLLLGIVGGMIGAGLIVAVFLAVGLHSETPPVTGADVPKATPMMAMLSTPIADTQPNPPTPVTIPAPTVSTPAPSPATTATPTATPASTPEPTPTSVPTPPPTAATASHGDWVTTEHKSLGVALTYPRGWQVEQKGIGIAVFNQSPNVGRVDDYPPGVVSVAVSSLLSSTPPIAGEPFYVGTENYAATRVVQTKSIEIRYTALGQEWHVYGKFGDPVDANNPYLTTFYDIVATIRHTATAASSLTPGPTTTPQPTRTSPGRATLLPGLTIQNILLYLTRHNYDCPPRFWHEGPRWADKTQARYLLDMSCTLTTAKDWDRWDMLLAFHGYDENNLTGIRAWTFADVTKQPLDPTSAGVQSLGDIAALPYRGSDTSAARQAVVDHIGTSPWRTKIGPVIFTLNDPQYFEEHPADKFHSWQFLRILEITAG